MHDRDHIHIPNATSLDALPPPVHIGLCADGDLRLVGGSNMYEGRVEFCFGEVWGTVCDDFWGAPDAQVVCRQLGFNTTGAAAFNFAFFGQGTGPIWLDNVGCTGSETRLSTCFQNPIGAHNCIHLEDAGVRCPAPPGKKNTSCGCPEYA